MDRRGADSPAVTHTCGMQKPALGRRAVAVAVMAVLALTGCTKTSPEPSVGCVSTTSAEYNALELADRLNAIKVYERPGYMSFSGSARSIDVYWYGPVPDDVAHEIANARACGAQVTVRPAAHSRAQLDALRHQITVSDRAAWKQYGITVLKTSNRDDGSGALVVVPDSVSIAEAQSFASSRYTIPILVISDTDAGL